MPMMTLTKLLDVQAKKYGDKPLLLTENNTYSYSGFKAKVQKYAAVLLQQGAKPGDRIAQIDTSFDTFYAALFAIWQIGCMAVPLNASLDLTSLQSLIDRSGASMLLYADDKFADLSIKTHVHLNTVEAGKADNFSPLGLDDIAAIMFTSGTTGLPKGVVQTMFAQSQNAMLTCEKLGLGEDDRIFINTPPQFTSGLCHFTTMLNAGGSLVSYAGFAFGKDLLQKLEETKSTGFGGAPAHLVRVVSTMDIVYENKNINFWMSSGDHLPKNMVKKAQHMLPHVKLFNVYGLTEVAGRFCVLRPEFANTKHGAVGTPIGNMQATIVDANGNPAAPGEIGEINADGELLFLEYLDMPDLTAKAKGPYGFKTGDFGYMDEDGFVFVEGRKDDIFKRGGEKVSTNKIKQTMLDLNMFKDVAVVAKDDMLMGKVPVACVVMKDDVPFKQFAIMKALKGKIAATHIPAKIIMLNEIPRTGSGKAILKKLKEIVQD